MADSIQIGMPFAECSHRAARTGVWLLGGAAGHPQRVGLWRERLDEIGLDARDCVTDPEDAARWLEHDQ